MSNVSPNIGLHLTESDERRNYMELRLEISGTDEDSNMMIIDREIGDIKKRRDKHVVYSTLEPVDQVDGDIWNEIIP